jgi:hypothetical protein
MSFETLTLQSIRARPVVLKLKRPVVARIATLADWPLILIDLYTEEGVMMVDFNQGLHFGEALERCHAIDDLGLAWVEEPIVYDNLEGYARLTADLKTPVQIGENFTGRGRSTPPCR